MIHYCTYFDRNYLTRGLALYRSLRAHSPEFRLWVLCLDDDTARALEAASLEGIEIVRLSELEEADPELLAVKGSRSTVEYYFTCSPSLPRFLMLAHPEIKLITYLDADLLFYSHPKPIFDELGDGSVLIVPHRFPRELKHLEIHGIYNVGLLTFRNDTDGLAVLERWRTQCIEWCYDRIEDGKFADQGYLNDWPGQPGVRVLQNPGAGLAPWNFMRYAIDPYAQPPTVDGGPLVFYHFQGVKRIGLGLWDVGLHGYGRMGRKLRWWLYGGYVRELLRAERIVNRLGVIDVSSGRSLRHRGYSMLRMARAIVRGYVIYVSDSAGREPG